MTGKSLINRGLQLLQLYWKNCHQFLHWVILGYLRSLKKLKLLGVHKTSQFIIYHEAHNDIRYFPCPDKPEWHAWCMEKDVNVIEMTESLGDVGRVKGQRFTTCLEPSYLQGLYTKHARSNKQFSKFCHPTGLLLKCDWDWDYTIFIDPCFK